MAKKVMEVVVCDLCKRERPAVAHVEIDVCSNHKRVVETKLSDSYDYECPECGARFQHPQGLGAHRRHAHQVVSIRRKATSKRKASRNG